MSSGHHTIHEAARVYIAGPMTGLPAFNYPAFHAAAATLRQAGYVVENPAENEPPPRVTWQGWMRLGIVQMMRCDAVLLLPGWHKSEGARIEHALARQLGLHVADHPGELPPPAAARGAA